MTIFDKIWHRETASSLSIMTIRVGMLAAKFLLTIFIARYMGLEAVGVFGLIVGGSGIVQGLLRGGASNVISRDAVHQSTVELTGNLRHYGTGVLSLYILLVPIAYVIGYLSNHTELALLALAVFLTEHLAFDIFVLVNNLQKPKLANILLSLQSASWIYLYIALAFFIPELRTIENVLLFWLIGGAVTIGVAMYLCRNWPWKEAFDRPLEWAWYKSILQRSWKLYVADVVSVIALYMDRYLITIFLSLKLAGIYVLFAQVESAIVNLVTSGVIQMYTPKLISAFKDHDMVRFKDVFKNCVVRALGSAAFLGVISAIVLPFLIAFTDKPEAMKYLPLFWLILAVLMVRMGAILARSLFYPMHMDKQNLQMAIGGLCLTTISLSVFLNLFGIYGIVVSTLVVSSIIIAYMSVILNKTDHWNK